ncbi:MAG: YegS/Rv2252/BmrU family lipid kinase [Chloroflexota bacterium]
MFHADLVYNPVSGRTSSLAIVQFAAEEFRAHGWKINLIPSVSAEHISQLARSAVQAGRDALIIAGGDGSVMRAATGLANSETALAVLPTGTANVWAKEIGLPGIKRGNQKTIQQVISKITNGRVQAVDIGQCNGQPFLLWAGIGLDGIIVRELEGRRRTPRRFAELRYMANILRNALFWQGVPLSLQVDNKIYAGTYVIALVSNIRAYAGGYVEFSPHACLDDGKMDLWLFEGNSRQASLKYAVGVFFGLHKKSKHVQHIPFKELTLEAIAPLAAQIDGEPLTMVNPVHITVLSKRLNVLVPQNTAPSLFQSPPIRVLI